MIFLGLLVVGLSSFLELGYSSQIAVGLAFAVLVLSSKIHKEFGPLPAIAFSYFAGSGLLRIGAPLFFFPEMELEMVATLESIVSQSTLFFILCVLTFTQKSEWWDKAFGFLGWLNACLMLVLFCFGKIPCFLFNNPAMDAAFVACTLPLFLTKFEERSKRHNFFLLVPMIAALLISQSSTGIMGACLSIGAFVWIKQRYTFRALLLAISVGGLFTTIGLLTQRAVLFSSSGRTTVWKNSMDFWMGKLSMTGDFYHWIGAGLGSFFMWGPSLQITEAQKLGLDHVNDGFFWMHNDWLQILFESGIIGLILALAIFAQALIKSRKSPALFAALLCYGSIAVIQMPLRHFLFAGFGTLLLAKVFSPSEEHASDECHKEKIN